MVAKERQKAGNDLPEAAHCEALSRKKGANRLKKGEKRLGLD